VADLKPIYLVHGDDDAKIDEWRVRLRRRAEAELGPGGLELFDAASDTPDAVAASLATLTFATGTRYLLADRVGTWKAGALDALLSALKSMPPDTVLVLLVRGKPLKGLVTAVASADGDVREHAAPKPWEMPRWVITRAQEHGLHLDAEAAKTLLGIVGSGQQRLARELEKLAIALHPETTAGSEDIERIAAGETQPKIYDLADAVVSGDRESALALADDLAAQGERPSRLIYPITGRLREVRRASELLDAGLSDKDLARALRAPPWRAKKVIALAHRADRESLARSLCRFADLELAFRGGEALDESTALTLALAGR